jgi:hypothetical protein
MHQLNQQRRKRRRKPTLTPRFGSSTLALEIGLLRLSLEAQREFEEQEKIRLKDDNK